MTTASQAGRTGAGIEIPTSETLPAPASVALPAEVVVGEILGWDACNHSPLLVALQAVTTQRGLVPPPPLHSVLGERLARMASGDAAALSPGPALNQALHRLVSVATRRFGPLHVDIVSHVFDRLGNDPELTARATTIRRAAAMAEEAMERHYCRLALDATGWSESARVATDAGASERLGALRSALGSFPYTRNYEQLTQAELAGLQAAGYSLSPRSTVAFCGAGPLPLTGILLHAMTGAKITLVEIDIEAAGMAQRLIDHLGQLGVVVPGSVHMVLGDAAEVEFGQCDVVIAASLVGADTMLRLVTNLDRRCSSPVLLVRSAAGLVGQFAYEPIPLDALEGLGCRHLGEVTPLTSVTRTHRSVDRAVAVHVDSPSLLAIAHHEVLNRTELLALR